METTWLQTDFGTFQLTASHSGLRSVRLTDIRVPSGLPIPKNEHLNHARHQLEEYFEGQRKDFELTLDWVGATDFYQAVWGELRKIPYGRTTSYQGIAEKLGDKNAIRAVGQANKHNPLAIIVPCHRVIAKNGDLQGYFYGLDFKRRLLALENPKSFALQERLF
ncbi:MAG: methylated-DNA--[protein]-cysteine S-methyltransferase [Bacteroidota bacterium]